MKILLYQVIDFLRTLDNDDFPEEIREEALHCISLCYSALCDD